MQSRILNGLSKVRKGQWKRMDQSEKTGKNRKMLTFHLLEGVFFKGKGRSNFYED